MVTQSNSIALTIGASKVVFVIHRSQELGDSADVAISLTIPGSENAFQSKPTILLLADLVRLAEYIHAALNKEPSYAYVPMNLGFELRAYDNDDYVTTIDLFLLTAEPEDSRRSYVGCRGPVNDDMLGDFAHQLKQCAI
jgi:hypothetical protein